MGDACEEDADCTLEPNDCPAPYTCYDMSVMSPDLPTVCLSESDCAALGC